MPAGFSYDEQFRVFWLDSDPADPTAPTVAEITAGTDLSGYLSPDGWASNHTEARVDGGDLLSGFDAQAMGRYGAAPALTFKRRLLNGDQDAYDIFKTRGEMGCLVALPFVAKGDEPASGDDAYVYTTCQAGLAQPQNTAPNQEQRFIVNFAVGGDIVLDAVVGGGGS
jgi:hypothetical protein